MAERFLGKERVISVRENNTTVATYKVGQGAAHSVSRTELLLLMSKLYRVTFSCCALSYVLLDQLTLMTNYDDRFLRL
jgi:hypothetical protein